ncbi:hypothetical protein CMO83_04240 [Candidatus Woesearchaeota archaeon]|jgi:hypothetical protein|nr:hypothetical protein [Candidatus Woesearchaeota archaeon]MDP6648321.1 hypothetical protein [Candidatus Woesearchaeota archaeon]|tara:strand:- start:3945 stop:4808 length:864 start_codon:yes stop_codon:yes gene_type:complete
MQKKGQITIFIILGIVLIVVSGIFFYINKSSAESESAVSVAKSSDSTDSDIVQTYAEACLKMVTEEALFNKIGLQGGYINPVNVPSEGITYSRGGVSNDVPYYIQGASTNYPTLEDINGDLKTYVEDEFENCFQISVFEDISLNILRTNEEINADVSLNEEDVSVVLNYPLTIKKENTETKLGLFSVILPIRLKALYESAKIMVDRIKTAQNTPLNTPPNTYNISFDCSDYNKNGITNVYNKPGSDTATRIIQFMDFSTYYDHYFNSYIFQFAVKNVNVVGKCSPPS